jgi:O-acetyl-ADP-ribose deacetylase (regulator of RNase III)
MIRYTKGNLLHAPAEALVNTVNEVGVMGKGIALMFREAFPTPAKAYEEACERGEVKVGRVLVTSNDRLLGPRWIIHFPTKRHWRNPSRIEWVRTGLGDLARVVRELGITSIAIPPLGCGNGGLEWKTVRREIDAALSPLEGVDVLVFEPTADYMPAPKPRGVEKLTPARALVAEMVRRYEMLDLDCTNLEVQKLAWFLQRVIVRMGLENPLKLVFVADRYGPYADGLRHLLNALDGSYLHCQKRLSDAGPFDPIWFEPAKRQHVADYFVSDEGSAYQPALDATTSLIDGYESPLGMELLATVDWLISQEGCEASVPSLRDALAHWAGGPDAAERKLRVLDERLVGLALERVRTLAS